MNRFPFIDTNQLIRGISPLKKGFPSLSSAVFCGVDTETAINDYEMYEHYFKPFDIKPSFLQTIQIAHSDFSGKDIKTNYIEENTQSLENLKYFPQPNGKRTVYVFAHNLEFDLNALFGDDFLELVKNGKCREWKAKTVIAGNSFMILKNILNKNVTFKFIDTFNFFKTSLACASREILKEEKYERPEWLGKKTLEELTPQEKEYFIKYAVKDAELTLKLGLNAMKICQDYDIPISYTYPSIASKILRKDYLKETLKYPSLKALKFIWNCYHGARCESILRGQYHDNIKVYDVNSLYPFAMTQPMPISSKFENNLKTISSIEEWEKNRSNSIGWFQGKFKFPEGTDYPCLPVKSDKLIFTQEGWTDCIGEEVDLALKQGVEFDKFCGYIYTLEDSDYNHPLKMFVNHFYEKKQELDIIKEKKGLSELQKRERNVIKLNLNSCYGKFAEKRDEDGFLRAGKLFSPLISSRITGIARALIGKRMIDSKSLYTDTDSIHTTKTLPTSTKLGDLKLEKQSDSALYVRSKVYLLFKNNQIVGFAHHGLQKEDDMKDTELLKLFLEEHGSKIWYLKHRLLKTKEALARGSIPMLNEKQKRCLAMSEDGKRCYEKRLRTLDELRSDFSVSTPLCHAY